MNALLIIDMQKGSFRSAPRYDADAVVERINAVADGFRKQGRCVLHVRHDGTREGFLLHGTEDWEFLDEIHVLPGETIIEKQANDAFYGTELHDHLRARGIDTLHVVGCATDFCVNATIHGALTRDYNVVVYGDCHTTADRPGQAAVELIAFHNWLWANLSPTMGRVTVRDTWE